MTKIGFIGVSATALIAAGSAFAQDLSQRPPGAPSPTAEQVPPPQTPTGNDVGADIIVTAQRQDQRLQDVPIAVSAFSARSLQEGFVAELTVGIPRRNREG